MHWLLRLYPRRWRERYEEEMLALLAEHNITPATFFDLLMGALDANLNYDDMVDGVTNMASRLRSGLVMIFCSFILFGTGWSMIQRINDPLIGFQAAAMIHPEFSILHSAVFIIGCIAFLAFLIGGLPVYFLSVKRALKNRQKDVLIPFWTAVSCLALFAFATFILASSHNTLFLRNHIYTVLIMYLIFSAILLISGTISVSLTISRTEFQFSELKLMFVPEVVILFGMVVSVVLSTLLIVTITFHAPQLFNSQDVSIPMFVTGLVFMALGTIFAGIGFNRGMVHRLN